MSINIKFGTDGWRAIIAKEFTVDNVARVAEATGIWLKQNFTDPKVFVGHDCRFGGELFMNTCSKVFVSQGIPVLISKGFVSTPMISLAAKKYNCQIAVDITASHNPPSYNGYKLKANFGGPLQPDKIVEIENLIPDKCSIDFEAISVDLSIENSLIHVIDIEKDYIDQVKKSFDLEAIKNSKLQFVYDAMFGAGQRVIPQILPDVKLLHCEENPSFYGQAPEPIAKNLKDLEFFLKSNDGYSCALATDGDADRIGMYNGKGEFIDSHHIILLLIHYLVKYKKMTGKVAIAFSVTPRVYKMCEHYNLKHTTTRIGFKEIASIMIEEDVVLGGEESGGIAVKGHIPERDGIWMGLIIWEFMAKSGKTLDELIQEVYDIVGEFKFERNDLHINEDLKLKIVQNCKNNTYKSFGKYKIKDVKTTDGFKYFFDDDRWVMIRPSGTEPVLRTYAEAPTIEEVRQILQATKETICN